MGLYAFRIGPCPWKRACLYHHPGRVELVHLLRSGERLDHLTFPQAVVVTNTASCRRSRMTGMGVRRGKAAFSSGCKLHPANAPAGSNRSRHRVMRLPNSRPHASMVLEMHPVHRMVGPNIETRRATVQPEVVVDQQGPVVEEYVMVRAPSATPSATTGPQPAGTLTLRQI